MPTMQAVNAAPQRQLNVLYIHHAGVFGGASRSLMELIAAFPTGSVRACAIVQRGVVATMLRQAGIDVIETRGIAQFDCTRYGYYRGLRWLIVLRELLYLPFTFASLLEAHRRWSEIDLVHVNDTTLVAAAAFARWIFRRPVVVHARARLAGELIARRTRWLGNFLTRRAAAVVAIDETVKASLPPGVEAAVVHNAFGEALGHSALPPPALPRTSPTSLRVGMVGSLSPMKGVFEFVDAARILIGKGIDVEFVLVGDDTRALRGLRGRILRLLGFARPVRAELERIVRDHGTQHRVHFVGFTTEVKSIYDAIDLICFPSQLDAPGRPVLEAAFSGVPAVVALSDPRPDTVIDRETGICIPARNPQALADAIEELYHDRAELRRLGENARALADRNFSAQRNAFKMLEVYHRVLE